MSEKPEPLRGLLKLAVKKHVQQLIARPFSFTYLTVNVGYLDATNEYGRLLNYIEDYPEPGKTQLTEIIFPVFVHLYLLLLQNSPDEERGAENSDAFYKMYKDVFAAAKGYETILKELHDLKNVATVIDNEYFSKFWRRKYTIKASGDVIVKLREFLEDIKSKALLYVLHFHFYYEDDMSDEDEEDEESKCDDAENDFPNMNVDQEEILPSSTSPVYVRYENPYFCAADFNEDESEITIAYHDSSLGDYCAQSSSIYVESLNDTSRNVKEIKLPEVSAVKYVPGKSDVILASYGMSVKQINTTTEKDIKQYDIHHLAKIWSVDVNSSHPIFATASKDFTVAIWNYNDPVPLKRYCGHDMDATVVKFHPNGFYFATGSADTSILLWTVEKTLPLRCFTGHMAKIIAIAFSPDGNRLASADSIGIVKIWDIRQCGETIEVTGVEAPGSNICFNDVSTRLAFCNDKGILRIWDIRSLNELVNENYEKSPLVMKFNKKREWKIAFKP